MHQLERRISALEQASPHNEQLTIIRRILSPGRLDAEIHRISSRGGDQQWLREPGESERAVLDRAIREVQRNAKGFAVVTAWPGQALSEVNHAVH